jgi:hypothetical protein
MSEVLVCPAAELIRAARLISVLFWAGRLFFVFGFGLVGVSDSFRFRALCLLSGVSGTESLGEDKKSCVFLEAPAGVAKYGF